MSEEDDLIFKIKWPDHDNCRAKYKTYCDAYFEKYRNALPPLSQLDMESQQTTAMPTTHHSPKQEPIFLLKKELGCGNFNTIYKAIDISTGDVHATKRFHHGD